MPNIKNNHALWLSSAALCLWAKKPNDGRPFWLPLVSHMGDSAAVARELWRGWLSDGVKQELSSDLGGAELARKAFTFLAAAHDIGKATPAFQIAKAQYPSDDIGEIILERLDHAGFPFEISTAPQRTPHALATQVILEKAGLDRRLSSILGAHHGKPADWKTLNKQFEGSYDKNYYSVETLGSGNKWKSAHDELISYALSLAGFSDISEVPPPSLPSQIILCGLLIMTDWIASGEKYFPYCAAEQMKTSEDSETRARNAWPSLPFMEPWRPEIASPECLFKDRFSFVPNPLQIEAADIADGMNGGIMVIEAPMGVGKTEAALVAAEIMARRSKRSGVFFALPSQATSDGIFPRMTAWAESIGDDLGETHTIKLSHGKAEFNPLYGQIPHGDNIDILYGQIPHGDNIDIDSEEPVVVHEWFEGRKKSMLADFVVGTVDQLLMAALKQKHVMLRHLGLANKVVIIDECHAYDAYMNCYLDMALRWLGAYNVPVIVLSATLPSKRRQGVVDAYIGKPSTPRPAKNLFSSAAPVAAPTPGWVSSKEYPLITYSIGEEVLQSKISQQENSRKISLRHIGFDDIIQVLDEKLKDGGCAGVIVNTVKKAQELSWQLMEHFGSDIVMLAHSRFLAPHRAAREARLLDMLGKPGKSHRPQKCVVVGTQVLEQSLDIDFDMLITEICPMDLLLQRMGRLHRHHRPRPAGLEGALCFVTGICGGEFEKAAKIIYGEYLLIRTLSFLPGGETSASLTSENTISLPGDIADLVQNVYNDEVELAETSIGNAHSDSSDRYAKAREEWFGKVKKKESRAKAFRINKPDADKASNMTDRLDTAVLDSKGNIQGEAAVRDADESIEVLLVVRKEGMIYTINDSDELAGGMHFTGALDESAAIDLAKQSVRLPAGLCAPWNIGKTIEALETMTDSQIPDWKDSPWLKGSLFLVLDESRSAEIGGYRLSYSADLGLSHEKDVDDD